MGAWVGDLRVIGRGAAVVVVMCGGGRGGKGGWARGVLCSLCLILIFDLDSSFFVLVFFTCS